ncbi:pyridine nucleotide-disulfide oxidoreductase/dicluster-binding protein [Maridesulfovibrio sp.]|uniref:pyridine nucleotide-disulfide oxidoreductase/dicluster-binding protein n=1 Tax=Maridesulfovibrio sp. TaxID=2795000 RepID=UPI002A18BF51|nr:pyridine nucleotide-disulfide oxidoreductase/dicluster-binding protein [Maridesulfovibrio sp.]
MNQKDLRLWEARCTQEEPPKCKAGCPLHVDGREFCKQLASGQVDKAWAVLCKTMPLPSITARICDSVCSKSCLREERGGGIEMAALERFCADNAKRTPPVRALPARGKKIAVFGAGLAGLGAAWDLGKKGFIVTLFCGDSLEAFDLLPQGSVKIDFLKQEIAQLKKMNVSLAENTSVVPEAIFGALDEFDAVFVDPFACTAESMGLNNVDPATLKTEKEFLFASPGIKEKSPIEKIAVGRKGALSIERVLQGASLTAGRDRDDPFETRLFTNISNVEPVSPVAVPAEGYSAEQALEEAGRCILCECLECVHNCAYLENFKSYPKVYARQIYNNSAIVMGTRQANDLINSCMLCGLCEQVCPENFAMQDLCMEARHNLVEEGHMPPSLHEFAFRDMEFADGPSCALVRHAPGTDSSNRIFFPGCQLTASDPEAVKRAYEYIRANVDGETGLMLRCCGAPADWGGEKEMFGSKSESLSEEWEKLGRPGIIAACPSCLETLAKALPQAEIESLWSVLAEKTDSFSQVEQSLKLSLQDPCTARNNQVLMNDVRLLLSSLDITFNEPELSGTSTECCGFGGLLASANPSLSETVARRRGEKLTDDGITYCAMCRDQLAKSGKRCLHMLDILFPSGSSDPAGRPAPGYSERRENRVRLREMLLKEIWNENPEPRNDYESVKIEFTPDAAKMMEERRILLSDVQKTFAAKRESGQVMENTQTGHKLIHHRPVIVTYWVEYEDNADGGYLVHRVWSHRMHILGGV